MCPTLMLTTLPELESLLSQAATAEGWAQVVHRCAWCQRIFDEHGVRTVAVAVDRMTVVTDGMCSPCGMRCLAQLARRSPRAA
jgi:hypothetical protein